MKIIYVLPANGDINQQVRIMDAHCEPPDEKWTKKINQKNPQFSNHSQNSQENILKRLLQFRLANMMKRQETTIGKSRVAHESCLQKQNQRPQ